MEENKKSGPLLAAAILGLCGAVLVCGLFSLNLDKTEKLILMVPAVSLLAALVLSVLGWLKNDAEKTLAAGIVYIVSLSIPSAVLCFIVGARLKKEQGSGKQLDGNSAGFWKRLLAGLIDLVPVAAGGAVIGLIAALCSAVIAPRIAYGQLEGDEAGLFHSYEEYRVLNVRIALMVDTNGFGVLTPEELELPFKEVFRITMDRLPQDRLKQMAAKYNRDTFLSHWLIWSLLGMIPAGWPYYAIMEKSRRKATLGKLVLRLQVTTVQGGGVSFARATGRYWAKILSWVILGIGFIITGCTKRKQALHDLIAGTLVSVDTQPAGGGA
jgi:uncharacterized RDD family membrane protein YckC